MKKRKRRRFHITSNGYLALGLLILLTLIVVCVCLLARLPKGASQAAAQTPAPQTPTPEPTAAQTPSPTPEKAKTGARMPTAEEEQCAVDGVIRTSRVVIRKGPGQAFDIIDKYDVGERVKVYAAEDGYYLVQVLSDQKYGFISAEFVTKFAPLPSEGATPAPSPKAGAIMGVVNVDEVSLRGKPSTKGNEPIGVCKRGMVLWVYFKTDEFYFVEVAETAQLGYVFAEYVMTQADAPAGTPVP